MVSIHLIFFPCLELRFPDVETNPGFRFPVPCACRILCRNMRGLSRNLSDLTVASSQYDLLLNSETLVSDRRHISEFLVPGIGRLVLLGAQLPIYTLNYWTELSGVLFFELVVLWSVNLPIDDL